tara:strand:+ start:198 stop:344 length:147 start_codon:yes stop_codon:yes gene_type:complete
VLGGRGESDVKSEILSVKKRAIIESASGVAILGTVRREESDIWVEVGV